MEREENNVSPSGHKALSTKTLVITGAAAAILIFLITGFSFEALFGSLFVSAASAIVYRSIFNAESRAEQEAIHVIEKHKNPGAFQSADTSSVSILEDLDLELETLLGTAFTDAEVSKIEKNNSPFDPTFTLSWKNVIHYLIKGKQL